jgi:hypothetical protein
MPRPLPGPQLARLAVPPPVGLLLFVDLVAEQDRRIGQDGAGDADAPLPAARYPARPVASAIRSKCAHEFTGFFRSPGLK